MFFKENIGRKLAALFLSTLIYGSVRNKVDSHVYIKDVPVRIMMPDNLVLMDDLARSLLSMELPLGVVGVCLGMACLPRLSRLAAEGDWPGFGCQLGMALRLAGVLAGQLVCYALGTVWFMFVSGMGLWASLTVCVLPFIIPDFLKGLGALALAGAIRRRLKL